MNEADAGWTNSTLYLHFKRVIEESDLRHEQRFQAQEKALAAGFAAAEKAVTKAESSAEKRFDSVNEFRGTLSDQVATFVPRREIEQMFKSIADTIEQMLKGVAEKSAGADLRLSKVEDWKSEMGGATKHGEKSGAMAMWVVGTLLNAALLVGTIIVTLIHK